MYNVLLKIINGSIAQPLAYCINCLIESSFPYKLNIPHLQEGPKNEHASLFCKAEFGFCKGRSILQAIDSLIKKVLARYENTCFAQATFVT